MKKPEEIKKALESCGADECHGEHTSCPYVDDKLCIMNICRDALAYITQLEACVPKWISVKDRLPEDGRYLVVTQKADGYADVNTAAYNDMGWWTLSNFGDITHWMPIPEMPKEE